MANMADPKTQPVIAQEQQGATHTIATSSRQESRNLFETALRELDFLDMGLDYADCGYGERTEGIDAQARNLVERLIKDGSDYIAGAHKKLGLYIEGESEHSEPMRGLIPCNNPTLLAFQACGRALESLTELRSNPHVSNEELEAALVATARVWVKLNDALIKLEKTTREDGFRQDMKEIDEDQQRQADADWAAFEARQAKEEGAPVDDDDRDQEQEVHEVEDVANWPGRTGGNWT